MEMRLEILEKAAAEISVAMSKDTSLAQKTLEQRWDLQVMFNGGSYVVNTEGAAIADFPLSSGSLGVNYIDREYIAIPLKTGRTIVGTPVIGKKAQAPVIVMGVPVRNAQGRIIGAMTGVINLAWPNFFDQVFLGRYGKTGGFLMVVPQQRLIAVASDKKLTMVKLPEAGINKLVDRFNEGYEGTQVGINPEGLSVLSSAKTMPSTGWQIAVMMPTAEAFAPIRDMQLHMLQAAILLTFATWLLIWLMLKKQLAPLQTSAEALARMAGSDTEMHPLPIIRYDEIGGLVGSFNRLLERFVQSTDRLKKSETDLATTLQSIGEGVIATDVNGRITRMNPVAEQLTGWSFDEARGRPFYEGFLVIDQETRMPLHATDDHYLTRKGVAGLSDHIVLVSRSGKELPIADSAAPITSASGEILGVVVVFNDISEQFRMEQALREGNETLRGILETTLDGYWRIDMQGRLLDPNPAYCRLSGYSREELLRLQVADLDLVKDADRIVRRIQMIKAKGSDLFESVHRRKDGSSWRVEISASYHDAGGGEMFLFIRDISERKQFEEKIMLAASVFSFAREAIMITDTSGTIIEVNESFCRITGYGYEEVIGKTPRLLNSGVQGAEFYAALWQALKERGHWYGEIWNRRKSGEIFAAMQTISTVRDHHGKPR